MRIWKVESAQYKYYIIIIIIIIIICCHDINVNDNKPNAMIC